MDVTTRCLCPGEVHPDGDVLSFVDKPDYMQAVTMQKSITILKADHPNAPPAEILAALSQAYILYGLADWTLVDEKGKPVPVTPAEIEARVLSQLDVAMTLTDEVDDLYSEVVLFPLLRRASNSSPVSRTISTTSRRTGSPRTNPTPSSRSSISTIPTDDTATTSSPPDGGFKSSPRRVSVA